MERDAGQPSSSSQREDFLLASKSYMQQHDLPLAVEQALLQVVPSRHPHPYEVLNQAVWLSPSSANSNLMSGVSAAAVERRLKIKRFSEVARLYRVAARQDDKRRSTPSSSTIPPAAADDRSSVSQSSSKCTATSIDELMLLREAAAANKAKELAASAVLATTPASSPQRSTAIISQGDVAPSPAAGAAGGNRGGSASSSAAAAVGLDADRVKRLRALDDAVVNHVDFDVFALLVDPHLGRGNSQSQPFSLFRSAPMASSENSASSLPRPSATFATTSNAPVLELDDDAILCVFFLFEHHQLLQRLRIPDDAFFTWVVKVFENHHSMTSDCPFFNFYQSLGVLQRCHVQVRQLLSLPMPQEADQRRAGNQKNSFAICSGAENLFALFFAAISANLQHPGVPTNEELCRLQSSGVMHPLALRYNDHAPIQQNAASVAFALLSANSRRSAAFQPFSPGTFGRMSDAAASSPDRTNSRDDELQTDIVAVLSGADGYEGALGFSPSPSRGRHSSSSNCFVSFRRLALSLLLAPAETVNMTSNAAAAVDECGFVASALRAVYLSSLHGWFEAQQHVHSSSGLSVSSSSAKRWKDLLMLQIQRCSVPQPPQQQQQVVQSPAVLIGGSPSWSSSVSAMMAGATIVGSPSPQRGRVGGSSACNDSDRWTAFLQHAEEVIDVNKKLLRDLFLS